MANPVNPVSSSTSPRRAVAARCDVTRGDRSDRELFAGLDVAGVDAERLYLPFGGDEDDRVVHHDTTESDVAEKAGKRERVVEQEMSAAGPDQIVRARIICDYLAGMTDGFATRIYKRMFDPDFGSIVDLV